MRKLLFTTAISLLLIGSAHAVTDEQMIDLQAAAVKLGVYGTNCAPLSEQTQKMVTEILGTMPGAEKTRQVLAETQLYRAYPRNYCTAVRETVEQLER